MKPKSNTPYATFAAISDDYWRTFGPEFSHLIYPRIQRWLRRYRIKPKTLLDLGCGTGTFAIRMAVKGWKVIGIDTSTEALRMARRKAAAKRAPVLFLRADMRSFSLSYSVDLVTSLFNSVNHLLSGRDLRSMFVSVSRALRPKGYFVFDLNHRQCFEEVWGGTSVVERPAYVLIRRDAMDRDRSRATARLALFLRRGNRWVLKRDVIKERWFSERAVRQAARQASLEVVRKEHFNPFPRSLGYSKNIKSLWLLRKRSVD